MLLRKRGIKDTLRADAKNRDKFELGFFASQPAFLLGEAGFWRMVPFAFNKEVRQRGKRHTKKKLFVGKIRKDLRNRLDWRQLLGVKKGKGGAWKALGSTLIWCVCAGLEGY